MSVINTQSDAGKVRYQQARAGFILQGTTLNEWCRQHGAHIQNVRDAFFGKWNGPAAEALVARITQAAGQIQP